MTTVLLIQTIVAEHYGISLMDIRGRSRRQSVAWARQVAMYFAWGLSPMSLTEIADKFARDRGTISHAILHVEHDAAAYPKVGKEVEAVRVKLNKEAA